MFRHLTNMKTIGTILICLTFVVGGYGLYFPCMNLNGTWRNQLGSNMTIETVEGTNQMTGHYNTSVESTRGAATISSKISGIVTTIGNGRGSLIAFNVLWNKGASITAWVGQCHVCDGEAKLHTTWVLRSLQTPRKRWMSTRINQDTFWRVEDVADQASRQTSIGGNTEDSDLVGKWSSTSGDSFDINRAVEFGGFEGMHSPSSEGGEDGAVFGRFDGNETYSALGFAAAHPDQVRGWAGHIYNPQETNKVIETSWLSHTFSDNCNNPRKLVQYGMDYYQKDAAEAA